MTTAPAAAPAPARGRPVLALAALLLAGVAPSALLAQGAPTALEALARGGRTAAPGADRNAPVAFTADEVEFDERENLVTARGAVEAWQGERILRADRMTYDRDTGVATAEGNVQLLEPDGNVLFADRVVLEGGMRDGAIEGLRALLAQNGRLAANGARRSGGGATLDLARPVYTSCDLCPEDPSAPPLWALRSRLATQDNAQRRIRFRDAEVRLGGFPVLYTPYLSMPDPSTPRSSGFLTPSFGSTRYLGLFVETPYYWAIDESSDLTLTPTIATDVPPSLAAEYRRRFNFGEVRAEGSVGYLNRRETLGEGGLGGHIFSRGLFSLDENWRAGFALNRATSETYLRAYRFAAPRVLPSNAFAEGFWGTEAYARVDARAYQGLRDRDDTGQIPFVLPNAYYERAFAPDALGGSLTADAWGFAITRTGGTDTRRAATRLAYDLPRVGPVGEVWTVRAQADGIARWADDVDLAPNFSRESERNEITGNVRLALDWRLPLVRPAGALGRQVVEPRVQVVTGPATGRQDDTPNEDAIDFEFTDANLFALDRFTGRDRQEGGTRLDAGLRAAWHFPNGGRTEGLVGRSFRATEGREFEPRSGLERRGGSDWVGRVSLAPTPWLDLTARSRLERETLDRRLFDGNATLNVAGLGGPDVTLTGGYLYTVPQEALVPRRFRREVYGGAQARVGRFWRVGGFGRYDLELDRGVSAGANVTYEDECLVFDTRLFRSYAEDTTRRNAEYPSGTTLLFRVGLKTLGDFGFRAL